MIQDHLNKLNSNQRKSLYDILRKSLPKFYGNPHTHLPKDRCAVCELYIALSISENNVGV